jgi:hypothetical protein
VTVTKRPTPKRESAIEDHLAAAVEASKQEHRKVVWQGRKSAPDRVVMRDADNEAAELLRERADSAMTQAERAALARRIVGLYIVWVEVKRPGGIAKFPSDARERAQEREHKRMRGAGQRVVLVDSKEGADDLVAEVGGFV